MNPDTFAGQWTRVRGEITSWCDKLTDADLTKVSKSASATGISTTRAQNRHAMTKTKLARA
jgi:hypothetical protein